MSEEYKFRQDTSYTKPLQEQSFTADVVDEFWLTWMGQTIDDEFVNQGVYSKDFDKDYNPYDVDNISGYEKYADEFLQVRNKEEHDFLKRKIERNEARRERLDSTERNILPALVANLVDPINFIPVPFVKGATFLSRATKGGLASAGLVGATEPIRHSYDPTATNEETAMYVGSAFFLGGTLSGFLAKRTPAIAKATKTEDGGKGIMDNVFSALSETEGKIIWDKQNIKIRNNNVNLIEGNTDIFLDSAGRMFNKNGKYKNEKKVTNLDPVIFGFQQGNATTYKFYKPIQIQNIKGKDTIIIDTAYLRKMYDEDTFISLNDRPAPGQVTKDIGRHVKNSDDLIKYNIRREIESLSNKQNKKEVTVDYNGRLDKEIYDKDNMAVENYLTDTGNIPVVKQILDQLDKYTDTGKVVQTLKKYNARLQERTGREIFELIGDYGASVRGATAKPSAYMEVQTKWQIHLQDSFKKLDEHFVEYMTGSKDSTKWMGFNSTAYMLRRGEWARNFTRDVAPTKAGAKEKSYKQFMEDVFDATADIKKYNSPDIEPAVKRAVDDVRRYFKAFRDEASELEMFATQKNIKKKIAYKEQLLEKISKSKFRTKHNSKKIKKEIDELNEQLEELSEDISPAYTQTDEYITRFYDREAILDNPDKFKNIIRNWYITHPKKNPKMDLDARVNKTYERVLQMAEQGDTDNILSMRNTDGTYKAGTKPLMQRQLSIPTKLLDEFVIKDPRVIMTQYNQRMGTAIEITRKFGDRHMDDFITQKHFDLIEDGVAEGDINEILNAFIDAKDKMYGTFNTIPPTNINKRIAQFIRNWTSLSSMGKVIYTAQADMGRPIMLHGVQRLGESWLKPLISNPALFKKMAKDADFLGPMAELTSNQAAMERIFATDMGTTPNARGMFGGLFNVAQKVQPFYYVANLLTPWTLMMKRMSTYVSQHRFIEDALKMTNGTATKADIVRMESYGIDKAFASNIARLYDKGIIQKEGKIFLPNATAWEKSGIPGAVETLQIYRQAIKGDVERAIITPSPNDKFNMMYGVLRANNNDVASLMDNSMGRALGFTKTQFGGKFQNPYMALPFQFYSWAIAATRKLAMSGLAGRDAHLTAGAISMIGFAMWGDYLKNPDYWYAKSTEEKFLQAIEKSGVLAVFSDLPGIIETATSHEYGIRPMLDMDSPFGEPEAHDALRPGIGPGPSNILDIYMAFQDGSDKEKKDAIRRYIPLNNFWMWDKLFRKSYNNIVDY